MPPVRIPVLVYLGVLSLLAVILTVLDKKRAQNGKWRIRESTLLLVSDLLITDYSSCEGDMIFCLHRPTFFYTSDLERYVSESRSLSQIFFDIPYPKCKTNAELVKAIQAYDPAEYEKMEEIYRRMEPDANDGHASEAVVDVMEKLMDEEKQLKSERKGWRRERWCLQRNCRTIPSASCLH